MVSVALAVGLSEVCKPLLSPLPSADLHCICNQHLGYHSRPTHYFPACASFQIPGPNQGLQQDAKVKGPRDLGTGAVLDE